MKKLSFFILISFIFIGFMNAQTITVTSPHSGDTWYKGHPYTITWTKTGDAGVNVKINIFHNSISQANFVEQLKGPNSGSKLWPIPSTYANGTYYIRIKGTDSSWNDVGVHGDSEAFRIKKKSFKDTIRLQKALPDFRVRVSVIPGKKIEGGEEHYYAFVMIVVYNDGKGEVTDKPTISVNWNVYYYNEEEKKWSHQYNNIFYIKVGKLGPGKRFTKAVNFHLGASRYILANHIKKEKVSATVDLSNFIKESNEDNNSATFEFTIAE